QAEDGIRDFHVTGVQTCALPISMATYVALGIMTALYTLSAWLMTVPVGKDKIIDAARDQSTELLFGLAGQNIGSFAATIGSVLRSEERRVGKECRSRGARQQSQR